MFLLSLGHHRRMATLTIPPDTMCDQVRPDLRVLSLLCMGTRPELGHAVLAVANVIQ